MKPDEQFWVHVHRALDERRDPREDEAVQELIAAEPERFRELQCLLDSLEQLPRTVQQRPRRRVAALVAAAIGAFIIGIVWCTHRSRIAPQPLTRIQERVISFEWEVGTHTPTSSSSTVVTDLGLTARAEYRDDSTQHTTWTTGSNWSNYP